ncbi:hypothetical protein QQF64_014108 [Cirrhinus molitorella]|uniref:Uncharacterized protein n=1 Tax=Cirrhinus molitorella TaxID=172907 RepID=A0ABR3LWN6_9TELE
MTPPWRPQPTLSPSIKYPLHNKLNSSLVKGVICQISSVREPLIPDHIEMFERSSAAVLLHGKSQAGSDVLADSASASGIDFLRHRAPAVTAVKATEQVRRNPTPPLRSDLLKDDRD